MRIACPSCAAAYEVPSSRLTPHKVVRCARCGGEWVAVREAVSDVPEAEGTVPRQPPPELIAPLPFITAMDRLAASTPPPRSNAGLIGAWILTLAVLVATAAATIAWREDIIRVWPPTSRILAPGGQIIAVIAQTLGIKAE